MVSLDFINAEGHHLLRLSVQAGQPVQMQGDGSWLDFDFQPYSPRLGRPVPFAQDGEEWARSLPAAYQGSALSVQVLHDDGWSRPQALPGAPAVPPTAGWPAHTPGGVQRASALAGSGGTSFRSFAAAVASAVLLCDLVEAGGLVWVLQHAAQVGLGGLLLLLVAVFAATVTAERAVLLRVTGCRAPVWTLCWTLFLANIISGNIARALNPKWLGVLNGSGQIKLNIGVLVLVVALDVGLKAVVQGRLLHTRAFRGRPS